MAWARREPARLGFTVRPVPRQAPHALCVINGPSRTKFVCAVADLDPPRRNIRRLLLLALTGAPRRRSSVRWQKSVVQLLQPLLEVEASKSRARLLCRHGFCNFDSDLFKSALAIESVGRFLDLSGA
jgi:hypothetical protein